MFVREERKPGNAIVVSVSEDHCYRRSSRAGACGSVRVHHFSRNQESPECFSSDCKAASRRERRRDCDRRTCRHPCCDCRVFLIRSDDSDDRRAVVRKLVEEKLLNLLPGYQLIKKVFLQFAGGSEAAHWRRADQVGRAGRWLPGRRAFVRRSHGIPAAPAVSVGAVQVVKAELVEKLDVSMRKVFDCITQLGIGLFNADFDAPGTGPPCEE